MKMAMKKAFGEAREVLRMKMAMKKAFGEARNYSFRGTGVQGVGFGVDWASLLHREATGLGVRPLGLFLTPLLPSATQGNDTASAPHPPPMPTFG
jgi:hypothetical protein